MEYTPDHAINQMETVSHVPMLDGVSSVAVSVLLIVQDLCVIKQMAHVPVSQGTNQINVAMASCLIVCQIANILKIIACL